MYHLPRIVVLFLVIWAGLAAETAPGVLARVSAAAQSVQALRIPFVQIKHLAMLDEPLETQGVMEIDRKRGALRWEFTGQAVLVMLDGRLRRWGADGREDRLDQDPSAQSMAGQMRGMLKGEWDGLKEIFEVSENDLAWQVVFKPKTKEMGRFVESLAMTFRENGAPKHLLLLSPGGDRTEYRFAEPDALYVPDPVRFTQP